MPNGPQIRVTYILSSGRSGSTLLNLLLGSHPDAVAVGELTHLPKNLALNTNCSCGKLVWQCDVWLNVIQRMCKELGADLDRNPYALELGFVGASKVIDKRRMTRSYKLQWRIQRAMMYLHWATGLPTGSGRFYEGIENTLRLYQAIRRVHGKRLIVDSSKDYFKGIGIYQASPPDTRMILLTRDGRASFYSRIRSGMERERSLKAWKNYYTHALPLIKKRIHQGHILKVRYESLATEPDAELRRICSYLGMEFAESMLNFRRTEHHVLNGNRMCTSKPSHIQLDRAWESELPSRDRTFFDRHAGSLNQQLGYE